MPEGRERIESAYWRFWFWWHARFNWCWCKCDFCGRRTCRLSHYEGSDV